MGQRRSEVTFGDQATPGPCDRHSLRQYSLRWKDIVTLSLKHIFKIVVWDIHHFVLMSLNTISPSLRCRSFFREYILVFTNDTTTIELMAVNVSNVFNESRPRQDGWLCADDIFRCVFFDKNFFILIRISLYLVHTHLIKSPVVLQLTIGPRATSYSEILNKVQWFSLKKLLLKRSSAEVTYIVWASMG